MCPWKGSLQGQEDRVLGDSALLCFDIEVGITEPFLFLQPRTETLPSKLHLRSISNDFKEISVGTDRHWYIRF